MKLFATTFALLLTAFCAMAQTYNVGHRTFTFTDAARSNRSVTGHIYYPAAATTDNAAFASGKFPVVVFGHGFTITWSEYDFFYNALAQNGYVVVMPTTEGSISPSHANFADDLKYLVTKMTAENALSTSPYYQRLTGKNAIMGHSMGGGCAFLAAAGNASVHAIATYAAATTTPSSITAAATVTCASLTFGGTKDCVAAPATNAKAMYLGLNTASPRTYIEIKNGSHCQFGKASAFSRCNLAEGTACGSTAAGFVSLAAQHQQMLDATLPWLNYYLKNTCTGWTQFNNYLTTSTLHTYLRAGAVGVGCRVANAGMGADDEVEGENDVKNTPFSMLNAFPNPFSTELTVAFDAAEAGDATVSVQDLTGKILNSQTIATTKGINIAQIDMNNASPGIYIIKAIVGNTVLATKIIKR